MAARRTRGSGRASGYAGRGKPRKTSTSKLAGLGLNITPSNMGMKYGDPGAIRRALSRTLSRPSGTVRVNKTPGTRAGAHGVSRPIRQRHAPGQGPRSVPNRARGQRHAPGQGPRSRPRRRR